MAEEDKIEQIFLEAYEANADAIYRHIYYRVFSGTKARDLTQETFMRTWQYLAKGKKVENLRAFLYRVASNLIIDESRKHREESLDAMAEEIGFEPASEEHIRLEHGALQDETLRIINTLPQREREIIVMRYVDDLDPKEIANILKISPNAASVRIHRAMQALKAKLHIENG